MNNSCSPRNSYFASSEYVFRSVSLVTLVSIPFSIYGFYCVIKVTPKQLIGVKWVLLNFYSWSVVIDIVLNVLSIPIMFFPSISGIMLGYGDQFGIPPLLLTYSIQVIVSVFASSGIALLENRQNLLDTKWKIKSQSMRFFMNTFNYLVAVGTVIPAYLDQFNYSLLFGNLIKITACPIKEFSDSRVFFFTDKPLFITFLMATQLLVYAPQVIFFTIHTWYHLVYNQRSKVSPETRKMQYKFFIGSFLQLSVPSGLFIGPVFYIWFSINTGYYNQEINNHGVILVSLHGLLGTICMILIHNHYRNHFVKLITFGRVDIGKDSVLAALVQSVVHGNKKVTS